jgi:translocator protein
MLRPPPACRRGFFSGWLADGRRVKGMKAGGTGFGRRIENSGGFVSPEARALAGFLAANAAVALLSGLATSHSVRSWYPTLAKPSWTPPPWVFGPAWTFLYASTAVAAWRVWRRSGWGSALAAFGVQLTLNAAWSFCFFGARSPLAGLVDIVLLWVAIVVAFDRFRRVDHLAAGLFAPYLAWVTFAAALNFEIWRLNR